MRIFNLICLGNLFEQRIGIELSQVLDSQVVAWWSTPWAQEALWTSELPIPPKINPAISSLLVCGLVPISRSIWGVEARPALNPA